LGPLPGFNMADGAAAVWREHGRVHAPISELPVIMVPGHALQHVFSAMHTRFCMVLPGVEPETGEWLSREVEEIVHSQERLLSRFDARSPLADLNRRAADEPVRPPAALWEVLRVCREHWVRTGGTFDIAQTARTDVWRAAAASGTEPAESELAWAAARCGFDRIELDDHAATVRFAAPGLQLDLGGIGKGLALDVVAEALRQRGVTSGFLSFGESSVAVIGTHPSGPYWPVGVADLYAAGESRYCFELCDAAMSTSGNRSWWGHIVNPRDGRLITGRRTLSVACGSAANAEALSTALLAVPPQERAELLAKYPGTEAVEIVYDADGGTWTGRTAWQLRV
ncbi:MAG TPA: FAD:protein FMN transferase, partial [Longimicrobiales bacterium]